MLITVHGVQLLWRSFNRNLTFLFDVNYFLWRLKTSTCQGVKFLLEIKRKIFPFKTKLIPWAPVQNIKGPPSPKRPCDRLLLFSNGSIVFLAIWLVARIFLRVRKLSRKFKTNRRSHVASIYFAKLPQATAWIYKSLGFYERHLLTQNVGIISCSPCESFNDKESEKSVCYVRISKRKQAISAEDSNSYLDIRLF